MGLRQRIRSLRILADQGIELFFLRLRLLHLDLSAQAAALLRIVAVLVLCGVLLVFGLFSLLFGLNQLLDDERKIVVFFGLAVLSLLAAALLVCWAVAAWTRSSAQTAATLHEMQQDMACLRGSMQGQERDGNEQT